MRERERERSRAQVSSITSDQEKQKTKSNLIVLTRPRFISLITLDLTEYLAYTYNSHKKLTYLSWFKRPRPSGRGVSSCNLTLLLVMTFEQSLSYHRPT
jgi:hypothetical protein